MFNPFALKLPFLSPSAFLLALAFSAPITAGTVPLSALNLDQMTAGWSTPKANHGVVGGTLSIAGKQFAYGVGTHAASKIRVKLAGEARRFVAQVGVDDSAAGQGSVTFVVEGDGRVLWESGLMTGGQPAKAVDVDLTGMNILTLRVTDGGDGSGSDHADWAEAAIFMNKEASEPSVLAPHESFSLETSSFAVEFQVGDDGRLYQRAIGGPDNEQLTRTDEAYPQAGYGYVWEPALQVVHADGDTSSQLVFEGMLRTNETPDLELVQVRLRDAAFPFQLTLCFRTLQSRDVIEQWVEIQHQEPGPVMLERMASSALLLNPANLYLRHFFGDWAGEMMPTTERLTPGTKVLDSKLGVRAHQFRNPSFILSLDGEPTETSGRVLAGSLEWSGSFSFAFDHFGSDVRAVCGVNPFRSTYYLEPNETFATPRMIWAWSDHGLGDMSRKLHAWARDFGVRDGHTPRTVLLNNWEATGFDFDFERIVSLFDPAREIGTELFLLDDGWFGNDHPRIHDRAGLGDWEPNRSRLPEGLAPLAVAANESGLEFGIWIEPEMVNPKSELFERHPDWIIRQPKRELELQRNQLALDLTRPDVQEFEWGVIRDILSVPGIRYAKWDCNRYLTQPGSSWLPPDRQSHLWIDYVRALYKLMDKTATTFPTTELMLCSGGGGRVDYGALRYFHEFWPSDNTDPVVRVPMQWDYSYFFPSIAMASHVTHWGNRPIHFSCSVAMSARFGMDLDLVKLTPEDRAICAGAIEAYKRIRDVTQLGDLYRIEDPHENARGALNYVSTDRSRAVVFVFQLEEDDIKPVRPQGLDPDRRFVIHELNPKPDRDALVQEGRVVTGEQLMNDGLVPSSRHALEAYVVELTSIEE